MGMSIDFANNYCKDMISLLTPQGQEAFKMACENRLKADMVAILTEIQWEIAEMKSYESPDGQDLVMLADIGILFQEKINELEAEGSKEA